MRSGFLSLLLLRTVNGVGDVALTATSASTTFKDTVAGAKCESRVVADGSQMECTYTVGDLRFTIAGVGDELASISFERSNSTGRYFAKMQMKSGCVLVVTGDTNNVDQLEAGYAFISPRSGRVFRSGEECRGH